VMRRILRQDGDPRARALYHSSPDPLFLQILAGVSVPMPQQLITDECLFGVIDVAMMAMLRIFEYGEGPYGKHRPL